jgi:hypothetical protein
MVVVITKRGGFPPLFVRPARASSSRRDFCELADRVDVEGCDGGLPSAFIQTADEIPSVGRSGSACRGEFTEPSWPPFFHQFIHWYSLSSDNMHMNKILLAGVAILLSACNGPAADAPVVPAPPAKAVQSMAPAEMAASAPPASATPAFADKVWKVSASSAVEVGTTYAFLSDGRLLIDSPHGTPLYGKWAYEKGALSMVEEGLTYPADIIKLDANTFQVRMHTPAGSTDITLVPAPEMRLPTAM